MASRLWSDLAIDPVCGMSIDPARAAASVQAGAGEVFFCSLGCRDRYLADPERYATTAKEGGHDCCAEQQGHARADEGMAARFGVPAVAGLAGSAALLAVYFGLLTLVSDWDFTLLQFQQFWPYITALALGFGIQLGLFTFLRRSVHAAARSGKVVAVTGTTSGIAMVSCCTHYLANLLPALGAAGVATLVGQYQVELFWLGLGANLAGIVYMSKRIMALTYANGRAARAAGAALTAFFIVAPGAASWSEPAAAAGAALSAQVSSEGMVSVKVTPLALADGQPWRFEVRLNTHSVSLDQDIAASAVLVAGDGREVRAEQWEGDPPGGHHRSGVLVFAAPDSGSQTVTLKIRGVGVAERVFTWPRSAP